MRTDVRVFLCGALIAGAPAMTSAEECRPLQTETLSGAEIWSAANIAARQRPERDGFQAARYVYTYAPGALYELSANPSFVSTILLEEGEVVQDIAAGDTARWMVTESVGDGGWAVRPIIMVKPQAPGLRTNIVLITDRRTYLVEAASHARAAYSAQIAWCYPEVQDQSPARTTALNFEYSARVIRGRRPAWMPTRIFDDGRRTWIEFDESIASSDLPPLFIITPEGVELTNYRFDGQRYAVDRLFDAAELRLGVRAASVVRIERQAHGGTRPSPRGRP